MSRYLIPAATYQVEEEIKRSRFITTVAWAPTVAAARAHIAAVSAKFADASHNCWAYRIGPPDSTGQMGMSDDGEPHGTAGRPMLTVVEHSPVGDLAVVVTRYFGGTLLGTGGLVKAYSGGVQLALASLPTIWKVPKSTLEIVLDYSSVTPLQRLLPTFEAEITGQEFGQDVTFRITVPREQEDELVRTLTDLTHGQALIEVAGREEA
jgi:uncharacterized YigZ family protein